MTATATTDVAGGLAAFLSEQLDRDVTVAGLSVSSAGARRGNVAFDASDGERTLPLVATILPTSEIEVNPMAAEAAVRQVAERAGVPVPRIHGVCLDPSYVGGPFFLSERVDGETVPRRILRLVQEHEIGTRVVEQLGEGMARLHTIDDSAAPEGLAAVEGDDPAVAALEHADEAMSGLLQPRPALAMGMRWLERHLPKPPERTSIVHGDVRNGNLIVSPDGLAAILDWELAKRGGDPMEDLAWSALRMWRFREDEREIGGFAGREPYLAAYERAGGTVDIQRFEWWKVLGTLRWGLGLAEQAAAHLDGRFSNIVMAASGRRVPELEWDLLMLIRPS